ncbi:MAG: winged helix-turn-helix domain-containing protein [Pseudomonadota bacterium]
MPGIDKQFQLADLTLSMGRHSVVRAGQRLALAPTSFSLLVALVEAAPNAISVDDLLGKVWPNKVVAPETVSQRVRLLRHALGDSATNPRYIRGIRGFGYQLIPEVTQLSLSLPTPVFGASHDASEQRPLPAQPSIVVLPFSDDGRSAVARRVALGISHDIQTQLGLTHSFFVTARGSALRYNGAAPDPKRLSHELGVRYILQGSIRQQGNRLALHVTLVDGVTEQMIWTEHYSRRIDDVFAVQAEITHAISAAVQTQIDRQEWRRALNQGRADLDAWAASHIGFHYMYCFDRSTLDEAERWFERAIQLDPTIPRPHAGLSWVHWQRNFLGLSEDRSNEIKQAIDTAQRALMLDPDDPFAHWAYGRALLLNGDLDHAVTELEQTTSINPSFAIGRYSSGFALMQAGQLSASLAHAQAAIRLSPYDPLLSLMLGLQGFSASLKGDYNRGAALLLRAVKQPNVHFALYAKAAVCCALAGLNQEAEEYVTRVQAVVPDFGQQRFLDTFFYRRAEDIATIKRAFARLKLDSET